VPHRDSVEASVLPSLARGWWFPTLRGLRDGDSSTYARFDLDDQPEIDDADDAFLWLRHELPKRQWAINEVEPRQQSRPLTEDGLVALGAADLRLPQSLRRFAAQGSLQRRVRSATACYLDLGDLLVRTSVDDAYLIHVLSDQQWVRHWLVYVDSLAREAVVTSSVPIGFELPPDWPEETPSVVPLDGSLDLEVCADSFAEFMYRFWIENELYFTPPPWGEPLSTYADRLRSR
jgi:hypothetical protein